MIEVEQPGGRDRPVRRPDAAEARAGAGGGGRAAARHAGRLDRPGGGPRPSFGAPARRARAEGPAVRHGRVARARRSRRPGGVGYPLLVRPSYVLGGRAMEICYSREALADYLRTPPAATRAGATIFLDRFLENAIEIDVDALCDGEDGTDRGDHAARRGGRRPLGRLRLRDPGDVARPGDARARSRRRPSGSPCGSA